MRKLIALALVLTTMLTLVAGPVGAANPTVTITVNAATVSITNNKATWNITDLVGAVNVDDIVYFSTDGLIDDDWALILNTGNVAVDIAIQGTDFTQALGAYNWTLAAATGASTYSLYANYNGTATYNIEVKRAAAYNDIRTGLAAANNHNWSMKFTAPSGFNAADDGAAKTAIVTLVASQT
jgi:hypothetical protein